MSDSDSQPLSAKDLNDVTSRTMYTIDVLWFLAVEEQFGFETAFEMNQKVWARCSPIHGQRLLKKLKLEGKPPLEQLVRLLTADPMTSVHHIKVTQHTHKILVFRSIDCPIQVARIKAGKGVYNGKPGCGIYYAALAKLIDPGIETTCIACAPNPENPEYWCEWEFNLPPLNKFHFPLSASGEGI